MAKLKRHGNRIECVSGCGTMVLDGQGECRDCRRSRIRAGKKRVAKMLKGNSLMAKIIRAWEGAKKQFDRVKNIRWNLPKNWRTVQRLHIPQRYQPRDPMVSFLDRFMNKDKATKL